MEIPKNKEKIKNWEKIEVSKHKSKKINQKFWKPKNKIWSKFCSGKFLTKSIIVNKTIEYSEKKSKTLKKSVKF